MPRYRRIEIGEYVVPSEALRLAEDIQLMNVIVELIAKLDPLTLANTHDAGYLSRRRLTVIVNAWRTFASEKLRKGYMNGKLPSRPIDEPDWQIILNAISEKQSNNDNYEHLNETKN